jgi:hypothetical protein
MRLTVWLCCAAAVVTVVSVAACGDGNVGHLENRLAGPSQVGGLALSIRPSAVAPEFLHDDACPVRPAFRARLTLDFATERVRALRGLRFAFTDRGGVVIPASAMRTSSIANAPGGHPVTLPASAPIPIPDTLPFFGEPIAPPASAHLVVVDFDCGVLADGVLTVETEAADAHGGTATARATVRIGR